MYTHILVYTDIDKIYIKGSRLSLHHAPACMLVRDMQVMLRSLNIYNLHEKLIM